MLLTKDKTSAKCIPIVKLARNENCIFSISYDCDPDFSCPDIQLDFNEVAKPEDVAAGRVLYYRDSEHVRKVYVRRFGDYGAFTVQLEAEASLAIHRCLSALLKWCFARYYNCATPDVLESLWGNALEEIKYRNFDVEINTT